MSYNNSINGYSINIEPVDPFFPQFGGKIEINKKSINDWIKQAYYDPTLVYKGILAPFPKKDFYDILNVVFLSIKDIALNQKDFISANHITDHIFNQFRPIWKTSLNIFKASFEIELWNFLLKYIKKWEAENHFKVKKGTPYFFNAGNYLQTGQHDFGFNLLHKAIEDDRFHGKKQDPKYDYHNSPAFLFASLNFTNRNNYLYNKVVGLVYRLNQYIESFNVKFKENLNLLTLQNKFLSQFNDFEDEILYFIYLIHVLTFEWFDSGILKMFDNNFAKMRNLDLVFSFCLLIDKIMHKKTTQRFFSGSTVILIEKLRKVSLDDKKRSKMLKRISKELKIDETKASQTIKNIVSNRIPLYPKSSTYNRIIDRKIKNSMLIYFLRNLGAHNLKLEDLDTYSFSLILQKLFFQFFIIVQDFL